MNENSDIIFVPDDSASHEWTERDSELVEEYCNCGVFSLFSFRMETCRQGIEHMERRIVG